MRNRTPDPIDLLAILQPMAEAMPLPIVLQLEPTSRCNFSCGACGRSAAAPGEGAVDLTQELFDTILQSLPDLQVIRFQGLGEPLLHPKMEHFVRQGLERKIRFDTISNGSLLTDARIDFILTSFDCFTVSLDSLDENLFGTLRTGPPLGVVLDGIHRLGVRKKELSSPTKIGINFVASHLNHHEIPLLGSFAEREGLDFVSIVKLGNWLHSSAPGYDEAQAFLRLTREKKKEIEDKAEALMDACESSYIIYRYLDTEDQEKSCYMPFYLAYINARGDVLPCCVMKVMGSPGVFRFGNIGEESFAKIWNGPKYREIRRKFLGAGGENPWEGICRSCPD